MLINELEQNTVSIDLGFFSSQEKTLNQENIGLQLKLNFCICVYIYLLQ